MSREMGYHMADLYPQMFSGMTETSTEVVPDAEDQTALNEDKGTAETVDKHSTSTVRMLISVVFVIVLAVLFGVGD